MKPHYSISELVPHSGKMSLLDSVRDHGDDWLEAAVTIQADSMFAGGDGVPAWLGLEYMAQAIGAYAGLQERLAGGQPKVGFLVGTRRYQCDVAFFPIGHTLLIKVSKEMDADNGLSVFACSISAQGIHANANLNVFQPDDVDEFLRESNE